MNKLTFPLKPSMKGPAVASLQAALRLCIDHGLVLADDEVLRKQLSEGLRRENALKVYGETTARLVAAFRKARGLPEDGDVDEATAAGLNDWLQAWGALGPATTSDAALDPRYVLACRVVDARGAPVAGLRVEAFDQDPRSAHDPLGEAATTNASGAVTFRFQRSDFTEHAGEAGPDVYFRVRRGDALLDHTLPSIASHEGVIRKLQQQREPIVIRVEKPFVVTGTVARANRGPARGLTLFVQHVAFGGRATPLGSTTTGNDGRYSLAYDPGTGGVNLEVRIQDPADASKTISLMRPRFAAAPLEVLNLVAPAVRLEPEFRRLRTSLAAHLGEGNRLADARESAEHHDLTVLNRATGWDARLIGLSVLAERLCAAPETREAGLDAEAVYGLLRAGLPATAEKLARIRPAAAERALKHVRDAGIVGFTDEEIAAFGAKFQTFGVRARLRARVPGAGATYGRLLGASGAFADQTELEAFARLAFEHRKDPARLWEETAKPQTAGGLGLEPPKIAKLRLHARVAFLTGNSEPLTRCLMQPRRPARDGDARARTGGRGDGELTDAAQLVQEGLFRAEAWDAELREAADGDAAALAALIPPAYAGKLEDRVAAYAADLARKLREAYPMQVLAERIRRDPAFAPFDRGLKGRDAAARPAAGATAEVLTRAAGQGFRLGTTPVASFLKAHPGVTAGVPASEVAIVTRDLVDLYRLYQITPRDEAMPALRAMGATAAHDVATYARKDFVARYAQAYRKVHGAPPPEGEAELVHRKALQVSAVALHVVTEARLLAARPWARALTSSPQETQEAGQALIKEFPTLESLFGSLDFCECQHCRSVLGPAAYLVDLLQCLEEWGETTGVGQPYQELVARRPDIPNLALTCENTNTVLPTIDVVNEIMEYHVAHRQLTQDAARDSGSASTEELLAEPQNVIREAYDTLRDAKYPLSLPFDLWIETARQFCRHFEVPLHRVFEALRPEATPAAREAAILESLGLSPSEVALFTEADPSQPDWFRALYGYRADAVDALAALASAKVLARRLGVTFQELGDVVRTGFVNPDASRVGLLRKVGLSVQQARFFKDDVQRLTPAAVALLHKDATAWTDEDREAYRALGGDAAWPAVLELHAIRRSLEACALAYPDAGIDAPLLEQAITKDIDWPSMLVLYDAGGACSFGATTLQRANGGPADAMAFVRINLFVRLWRKLGWSIGDTDRALQAFVPPTASFSQGLKVALVRLAHLASLLERLELGKADRQRLLSFWSDMPTRGDDSLYARLFLTREALKLDAVFDDPREAYLTTFAVAESGVAPAAAIPPGALGGAHPNLTVSYDPATGTQRARYQGFLADADKDAIVSLVPQASQALTQRLLDALQARSRIPGHLLALQGALGLTADDVACILADAKQQLATAELSLANVSLLHRHAVLARALGLPVRDLVVLKQLSGLDPFAPLRDDAVVPEDDAEAPPPPDGPSATLAFVELAAEIAASGLALEDLDYLLRHRFDPAGRYRPDPDAALALLRSLSQGVAAIQAEHRIPTDPGSVTDEVLRQKLGLVLDANVADALVALLKGSTQFSVTRSVPEAGQLDPAAFSGEPRLLLSAFDGKRRTQTLAHRGVLFEGERDEILARVGPSSSPDQRQVLTAFLDDLVEASRSEAYDFFTTHLLRRDDPAGGFLERSDFEPTFAAPPSDPAGAAGAERARRSRLVRTFWPHLQGRLIRQYVVESMTAHAGAERALVESLVADERILGSPGPLLDAFVATAERAVTGTFQAPAGPVAGSLVDADLDAVDPAGHTVRPIDATSAELEGWFEVPAPGRYRFFVELAGDDVTSTLSLPHLPKPTLVKGAGDAGVELKAGVPYRFTLAVGQLAEGRGARLQVQGERLAKGPLSRLVLYPGAAMKRAERARLLLAKVLQLVQALDLDERDVRHVATHATDFGLSLGALPTAPVDGSEVHGRFEQLRRLAAFARLKRELAGGTGDMIGVFEARGNKEGTRDRLAELLRRDRKAIDDALDGVLGDPPFTDERPLRRLWEVLQLAERFGVQPSSLKGWTEIVLPETSAARRCQIALDLKEATRARFEPQAWRQVARPIFDRLRQRQRDALVAHLLHELELERIEQLYAHFLLDPGVEPVVQTSRIRLAISSVQLFIQRCFLNLEDGVRPSAVIAARWKWMKRYRVWEANRKIFLFPENWLEPEFRDDKSPPFQELESALLQGDVADDVAEDAFFAYLKKLDELARLDVVAMCLEEEDDPSSGTLHVFGRTFGEPRRYFHRRRRDGAWTPWEAVTVEVEGDHLAPVIWRGHLYLFWVTFTEKPIATLPVNDRSAQAPPAQSALAPPAVSPPEMPSIPFSDLQGSDSEDIKMSEVKVSSLLKIAGVEIPPVASQRWDADKKALGSYTVSPANVAHRKTLEVQLHWSEYANGEWSSSEASGTSAVISRTVDVGFSPRALSIHVVRDSPDGTGGVRVCLGGSSVQLAFYLPGRNSLPEEAAYPGQPQPLYGGTPTATRAVSDDALAVLAANRQHTLLETPPRHALLSCSGPPGPDVQEVDRPFFYMDGQHTMFAEPFVERPTVSGWESPPQPGGGFDEDELPDDDLVATSVVPDNPGEWITDETGWRVNPSDESAYVVQEARDWLINDQSLLLVDEHAVASNGWSGVRVFEGDAAGGDLVFATAGSDVAAGSHLAVADAHVYGNSGVARAGVALNVIGSSGLNVALAQSCKTVARVGAAAASTRAARSLTRGNP